MENKELITTNELAKILGISRVAVFKKIKKGQIRAIRVGKNFVIPKGSILQIIGKTLSQKEKEEIDAAVKKTVKDYGETLRLLGKE
ncbi:MAG: helix-turn-helix domain-containing protein [Candidatus Omnitrophica bacterium]|nr:helix-turn-helix domain-containing protein [Candidatus Omnitrophota bacterium]MCM8784462.1 helix-turn-helix domain-containing protein [Candidatus Omnitrophota bacterium]